MSKIWRYLRSLQVRTSWKKYAGLICLMGHPGFLTNKPHYLHLFVRPSHWEFGRDNSYRCSDSFGLGPLFLLCWYK